MTGDNTWLQAVVVSIDPRRVYLNDPSDVEFKSIRLTNPGKKNLFLLAPFTSLKSAIEYIFTGCSWYSLNP
jgi:hypothetical protein